MGNGTFDVFVSSWKFIKDLSFHKDNNVPRTMFLLTYSVLKEVFKRSLIIAKFTKKSAYHYLTIILL